MSLNFAAIDVETANRNRGSVCSFGVAVVNDGCVVAKHQLLTRPPKGLDWFDGFNTALHGIGPEAVVGQPGFEQRLAQVLAIVGDLPLVAHNAAFDIGAIRMGCDADELDWPTLSYACSLVMSRRAGLGLISYRLPMVCNALGIQPGRHHEAGDDARSSAQIVLALAARQGTDTLEELTNSFMIRLGRITHTEWAGCIRLYAGGSEQQLPVANPDTDPDHPLYGAKIAFTGGLGTMTRPEAFVTVANLGATPQDNPTKETDYLVIGDGFNGSSPDEFHTGKATKAVKVNAKGGHIEVLTEGDLWKMLAETRISGTR